MNKVMVTMAMLAMMMAGCGKPVPAVLSGIPIKALARVQERDEALQLADCVLEQMAALQAEDVERVMYTLHPDSVAREQLQDTLPLMFTALPGCKYSMLAYEHTGTGRLKVTQLTSGLLGFRENVVVSRWDFRKDENGVWKFWDSKLISIRYTDADTDKDDGLADADTVNPR